MHYSAVNAVNAASPASASPSSSSLSPIGSSLVGNHSHQSHSHSHSHYHHLSGNDGNVSAMSHHSELMASLSDSGLSPVSVSQSAYNGVVSKSEPMCDDLATSTTTYTTLQSAGTAPVSTNTHNGHYAAQQSTVNQSGMAQSGNASSSSAPPPPQAKGVKRSAPSATATKSTYSNGGKANGTASANGTSTAAGAGGSGSAASSGRASTGGGKKTKGRVKIKMEFIDNKLRRYTTFSKRKTGIMKKAYELSTLTGTQVMLLVASETGHVYTFATRKLQPMITSDAGKALIQTCLNSPDPSGLMTGAGVGNGASAGSGAGNSGPDVVTTNGHISTLVGSGGGTSSSTSNGSNSVGGGGQHLNSAEQHHNSDLSRMMAAQQQSSGGGGNGNGNGPTGSLSGCSTPNTVIDQRMSATGFEETELSYSVNGDDCSPLNDKSLFNSLNLGNSVNLMNSSFASTSNGHLLRQRGSTMPQTNFFINETPEFGQCSDDDEDDDEEEDEDEEMDEGEEDIDLDPDMAYLAGLQSIDTDLTRFIGGPAGTGTSTPLLLNDAMLGSAMWPSTGTQHTMGKPVTTTVSAGQLQQQQQQQAQQQQCTGSSAGYVSDRTKLNLNLKLQQKQQQMQQRGQPPATSIRSANSQSASQQKPSQAFNANFQGPKQTTTGKTANHPKAITTPLVKNVNSKRLTSSSKSSGKSTAASTSNLNSNCSPLVLNASTGISTMNSANSSFVNFDPASFLDSCFNTGNVSPESTSLLDGHSSLDQMLMNNSELLLLNQPNSALGQTMTTEQLMMMIGSQTPISHGGQYSAPTSIAVSSGSNSGGSSRSTSKNSNNRQPVSSQIFAGTRTPTSIMHHTNSSSFSSNSGKHSNAGSVQLHFSSTHAGNGSCSSNNSNSASLCPMTTSTVSTLSNHKQAQSVAQSKAANLNAIINNLASANNGAASVGAGAGNQNSGGGNLDGSSSTQQHAAQQFFSGSAGNFIFCTNTPTSSTIAFPPSAAAASQLDQRHSVTSLANSVVSTSTASTQLFSFPPGISAGGVGHSGEGPPTTLLLPANLHTASGQLSIQQPVASGAASAGGQHAQQLIYNAFSRFIYPSSATNANQGQQFNVNRSVEANSSGPLAGVVGGDSTQTISTLISHDGQLYQLNVANNSASPIAQIVTPNLPLECSSSSRLRIKAECHSDGSSATNSSISLLQPNTALLHSDLHSISLDSLLGSSLGPTPAPLITTFQPTLTPISTSNANSFGSTKSGLKKQRSK